MPEDTTPEVNVEEVVTRTLNEYIYRQRQEEDAEVYEQQELRKFALELAAKTLSPGNVTLTYTQRANELLQYIKSG